MNWMTHIGGRKFLLALIAIGIGTAIELTTDRGVSASFAGLLAGIIATFSAANFAVTNSHMKKGNKGGTPEVSNVSAQMNEINNSLQAMAETQTQAAQITMNTHKLIQTMATNLVNR